MVSKSAKYYQAHPAAMARKVVYEKRFDLLIRKMLSVWNWLVIIPNTIKSTAQLLVMERMLHIPSHVSGTNIHLSIVALKRIGLWIEWQEVVDDSDIIKGSHYILPFPYLNKSLISQSIASATLVRYMTVGFLLRAADREPFVIPILLATSSMVIPFSLITSFAFSVDMCRWLKVDKLHIRLIFECFFESPITLWVMRLA